MQRGIALGVPAFTVAVGAGLCHEFYRVAHAPLPRFEDNDPSGVYGSGDGPPVRVDVLGDSSVTAPGLDHGQLSWVALACDSMNARVDLRSRARGGSRVADVLESQIDGVLEDPPEVAIVSVGANDVLHGTPARSYRRDLVECLDSLRSVCDVVTLGVGDLSVIPRLSYTLRLLVARRSATFDRLHEDICSDLRRVTRVSVRELADPFFAGGPPELFTADLFHPNEVGHRIWAACFERSLRVVLEGPESCARNHGTERTWCRSTGSAAAVLGETGVIDLRTVGC